MLLINCSFVTANPLGTKVALYSIGSHGKCCYLHLQIDSEGIDSPDVHFRNAARILHKPAGSVMTGIFHRCVASTCRVPRT